MKRNQRSCRNLGLQVPMMACLILGCAGGLSGTEVVDTVVRYVNGEVLTLNTIRARIKEQVEEMHLAGKVPPNSREFFKFLQLQALREETADMLLEQEAIKLNAPVDTRLIRREVMEETLKQNRYPTITEQINEIKRRTREGRIQAVEGFFLHRQAGISPQQIADAYKERIEQFRRPARARVWRIVVRPTVIKDLGPIRKQLTDLVFKGVRSAGAAELKAALPEDTRKRFLAAESEADKCAVLVEALEQVLSAAPDELGQGDDLLVERCRSIVGQFRNQIDEASIKEQLAAMRAELDGIGDTEQRLERFKVLAKQTSAIGREAEKGGDAGLKEPGDLGGEYDGVIFALEPFVLSEPFQAGDAWCLLMISEMRPPEEKSLQQVSAELRNILERERRLRSREELVQKLWAKAVLVDTSDLDLDRLLREAGAFADAGPGPVEDAAE